MVSLSAFGVPGGLRLPSQQGPSRAEVLKQTAELQLLLEARDEAEQTVKSLAVAYR